MKKKVKIIRKISPKKREIREIKKSELEEDISEIEEENFGEFISSRGASAPVLEVSEMAQEIPIRALAAPPTQVGGEVERTSYVTQTIGTEEEKRKYNPSIEAQPIKEAEMIKNQHQFREQELTGMRRSEEEREQKYMAPEVKKEEKRRYPWER